MCVFVFLWAAIIRARRVVRLGAAFYTLHLITARASVVMAHTVYHGIGAQHIE